MSLVDGIGNTVPEYTTITGKFTQIGNRVFVDILLDGVTGSAGAGTGQVNISLPLQASATQVGDYIIAGHFHNDADEYVLFAQVNPSATTASLFIQSTATQTRIATGDDQNSSANRTIKINLNYTIEDAGVSGFVTRWTVAGNAAARTIHLPLSGPVPIYDCYVNWGDGTPISHVTASSDPNRIHIYAADGTYDVEIRGICEGWAFNFSGDANKITAVVSWGSSSLFGGFNYCYGMFYGCTNLTSLPTSGSILASGAGVGIEGFENAFSVCSKLTSVGSADIFKLHPGVTARAFTSTFASCVQLASIPANLFRYNILVSTEGFWLTFQGCSSLVSIPSDLFRYNTQVSTSGFYSTFAQTAITTIPSDLFRYNTLVSSDGFRQCFYMCPNLAAIPVDLFRYNTLVSTNGFRSCFYQCTSLINVPADLFRYNTAVSDYGFRSAFYSCTSLVSVPVDLFRYNTAAVTGAFQNTFLGCSKLQLNPNIFYADGEEATRFLDQSVDLSSCFDRDSFAGVQGTAPDLWNCNFGSGTPVPSLCFGDAGNSLTSLANYEDIPVVWKT
jgi:hypothetical protein